MLKTLNCFFCKFISCLERIERLGAIGMWMQFKNNKQLAISNYMNALSLGGTKTLPALYEAAGLKFDLSPDHIKTLMQFVNGEMEKL